MGAARYSTLALVLHFAVATARVHLYKTHACVYFQELTPDLQYKETVPIGCTIPLHQPTAPANLDIWYHSACMRKNTTVCRNAETLHQFFSETTINIDLANLVFCPLSDPKILQYVLLMSKKQYDTNIIELNLASNNIEDIRSLEMMTSIQHLDLRNNSIDNIEKLESLQRLSILTLWLDGNPVCENYDTHAPYIKEVKRYVTTLKRLDGVLLGKPGFTLYHRNFLVDGSKHAVVDHFLGHYFNLYDSGDRLRMKGLYNSHSLFSLTAVHLTVQSISSKERLTRCMGRSRNLLKKEPSIIHHGEDNILAIFQHLPSSKHDPYSFTVDTAYVKDKMLSVYVCGVFQEPSETKVPLIRSFSRMFMLLEVRPNEFQVINEMLHVSNATTAQAKEAFKYERPPIVVPSFAFKAAQNLTDVDKSQLVYILADVTEMNSQWSQKCLEEANWDFKDALVLFTELYKRGGVPAAAFIK